MDFLLNGTKNKGVRAFYSGLQMRNLFFKLFGKLFAINLSIRPFAKIH